MTGDPTRDRSGLVWTLAAAAQYALIRGLRFCATVRTGHIKKRVPLAEAMRFNNQSRLHCLEGANFRRRSGGRRLRRDKITHLSDREAVARNKKRNVKRVSDSLTAVLRILHHNLTQVMGLCADRAGSSVGLSPGLSSTCIPDVCGPQIWAAVQMRRGLERGWQFFACCKASRISANTVVKEIVVPCGCR